MAKRVERALNAVVNGVFAGVGAIVRGITAAAAWVLRRGRHRAWRREADRARARAGSSDR